MDRDQRKAAGATYRERKPVAGIYAVVCRPSGQRWIGRALDVSTVQNRLWFTSRQGGYPHATLQAAWNQHGPDAFSLDIIERLDDEALGYVRDGLLKNRLSHWCSTLAAEAI
ncbi:GIY-YIG nuclease family protein [Bradyrhizobium sp.]|uniref:GIY-YIG nuclease family protein n=1 Tax=Bradyrhizobium sp. TaxID=376 RepID=UPI0025C25514|nr:GIY-YIG nuclease family protein [Bradyrhizobium sp.]MBV8921752.1 GIY-YIG nuclease family protein [Bradyrhizobium sp.]